MRAVVLLAIVLTSLLAADSGAGIRWTAPSNWKSEGERPMRLATYEIPEGGECAVYYFGQGQGGSVEANIDRWKGQFERSKDAPKVEKRTIHGLKVTTLDVSGSYTGAIVEGPQGPHENGSSKPKRLRENAIDSFPLSRDGEGVTMGLRLNKVDEDVKNQKHRSLTGL